MPRYRLIIEYDGTPFAGWQIQADRPSVQGAITDAVLRFSGEQVTVKGAGRTDAGVHATGQVAHFDLERTWDPGRIREALNYHLKAFPLAILDCAQAAADFDARFSATGRQYLYRLLTRRARPALDLNRVWWVPVALEADAMHAAAQTLIGRHDFTTFRAAACQANSPVRTLDRLDVMWAGEEIQIAAAARSFLHNQVRSMVGTLKLVGEGKLTPADVRKALEARDRACCGALAPPGGLYLTRVTYPEV